MEHRSDCEQLIADLVENHFGIEKHLKGCTYLKEAIEIAVQNPIVSMMKLYELVGLRHGCNAESVEHLIRYAIESAYTKNKMNHYFPEVYGRRRGNLAGAGDSPGGGVCPDIRNVTFYICKIDETIWKSTCLMETSGRCFLCQK